MNMLTGLLAALATVTVFSGYKIYQVRSLQDELQKSELAVGACNARLSNITADMESDREVDNLSDGALYNVPSHWLRNGDGPE